MTAHTPSHDAAFAQEKDPFVPLLDYCHPQLREAPKLAPQVPVASAASTNSPQPPSFGQSQQQQQQPSPSRIKQSPSSPSKTDKTIEFVSKGIKTISNSFKHARTSIKNVLPRKAERTQVSSPVSNSIKNVYSFLCLCFFLSRV